MADRTPPRIVDADGNRAPGLTWRWLKKGWQCTWRARADLVIRGYRPRNIRLWAAKVDCAEPTEPAILAWIADRANAMQAEMLVWARGGLPQVSAYDGTWRSLVACYQADPDSPYRKLRYGTRLGYDRSCRRLVKDAGDVRVADTDARRLTRLYEGWAADGKIAMGHSMVGMVRTVVTFGATFLKLPECRELKITLHDMRFTMPAKRKVWITAEQAEAIIAEAHKRDDPWIARAQAFQFEMIARQKDIIGEWIPQSEPGLSDETMGNEKWMRGIRWEEIDENLTIRHITSKRGKELAFPLARAPMIMAELRRWFDIPADRPVTRTDLPTKGPIIICETGRPWIDHVFRRRWRAAADAAGVPPEVYNMDSRSGGITEATDGGASLEHVRQAATHSDLSTTAGYSRGNERKTAEVMDIRAAHREQQRNAKARNGP